MNISYHSPLDVKHGVFLPLLQQIEKHKWAIPALLMWRVQTQHRNTQGKSVFTLCRSIPLYFPELLRSGIRRISINMFNMVTEGNKHAVWTWPITSASEQSITYCGETLGITNRTTRRKRCSSRGEDDGLLHLWGKALVMDVTEVKLALVCLC